LHQHLAHLQPALLLARESDRWSELMRMHSPQSTTQLASGRISVAALAEDARYLTNTPMEPSECYLCRVRPYARCLFCGWPACHPHLPPKSHRCKVWPTTQANALPVWPLPCGSVPFVGIGPGGMEAPEAHQKAPRPMPKGRPDPTIRWMPPIVAHEIMDEAGRQVLPRPPVAGLPPADEASSSEEAARSRRAPSSDHEADDEDSSSDVRPYPARRDRRSQPRRRTSARQGDLSPGSAAPGDDEAQGSSARSPKRSRRASPSRPRSAPPSAPPSGDRSRAPSPGESSPMVVPAAPAFGSGLPAGPSVDAVEGTDSPVGVGLASAVPSPPTVPYTGGTSAG
jgi:hypothetical protein